MKISKERQQVLLLGAVLVTIVGILLYVYRGAFLPRGEGELPVASGSRIDLPSNDDKDPFFERADYQALRATPGVPVQPLTVSSGGVNPFEIPKK